MTKLYTDYAEVYHLMYQGLIDYDEEFEYYQKILDKHQCKSILEVACGTGQLARRFLPAGYLYEGLDMSAEMLEFAREALPHTQFYQQDMRDIQVAEHFDAVLITARSVSYLMTNLDLIHTFQSIRQALHKGGILAFDFIDANTYIPYIQRNPSATHEVDTPKGTFKRDSRYRLDFDQGWRWTWSAQYFKKSEKGNYELIGNDDTQLRSFTEDEMKLSLELAGLKVLDVLKRPSYAYDTKVAIAQRV